MDSAPLAQKIEALLFALGEPLSLKELASVLEADSAAVEQAITQLRATQTEQARGIITVSDGKEVELRAAPESAALIEKVRKEAYARDIGKAGLEVLSAVLYQGPLSRSQIDFIRGVNSAQTLRTLAMRGLVRKIPKPGDERSFLYEPTTELLAQLGVSNAKELPEYESIRQKLAALKERGEMEEKAPESAPTDQL